MASLAKILPQNVAGDWFVDSTCIDCDTCRQLAPQVFGEADGYSFVQAQPARRGRASSPARAALLPTGSIGTRRGRRDVMPKAAFADFPLPIDGDGLLLRLHIAEVVRRQQLFHSPSGRQLAHRFAQVPAAACPPVRIARRPGAYLSDASRRRRRRRQIRPPFRRPPHHPPPGIQRQPDAEQIIDGFDAVELAPELPRYSHARPHRGPHGAALRRPLSLHRRSSRLGPRRAAADRLP